MVTQREASLMAIAKAWRLRAHVAEIQVIAAQERTFSVYEWRRLYQLATQTPEVDMQALLAYVRKRWENHCAFIGGYPAPHPTLSWSPFVEGVVRARGGANV